ncbi:hypothetical protein QFC20_007681 [Naganishia adeliensis]|uniref:Uncharacterized protein n=1 Tax=Naganishia adeliensis TaxID=92952 RepID=A0ACC2UWB6_9TREE|nr:hypothetical protein QFC20_007681 [Naganishia adeliensis]
MARTALIQFKVASRFGTIRRKSWCHNNPDESVEGVAFGPEAKVASFRSYLSRGPPSASVQHVQYPHSTLDPDTATRTELLKGITDGFHVRRFGQTESIQKKGPKH